MFCARIARKVTFFHLDAFRFQQTSQSANFILQLADKLSVRIFVDNGFADNLLGSRKLTNKCYYQNTTPFYVIEQIFNDV